MGFDAIITALTILIVIILLIQKRRIGPDLIMASGLVILMIARVVSFDEAVAGFAQRPMLMIAGLFVVAGALQETGGIELIGRKLLGRPSTLFTAQLRMMVPVASMSAFMNTTGKATKDKLIDAMSFKGLEEEFNTAIGEYKATFVG